MLETKVMFNATELTIKVSVWARGDPFPAIGHAVGIDTETELITDAELTPPLVVLGVFNPADMTCYQIAWTDAQYFMQELLKRDCKLYFANAGFDYFELESDELRDAVSNDRLVDLLIRAPLKEIATIGYIRTHSLKDACQWHLNYEMDKHEDEGDQAARVTFRRNKDITDEQRIYLAIDCASTYYACEAIGPQATECTHTRGQIVLYHISKNGFPYDPYMFDYCEKLLQQHMDQYRAELITYGYPDPYKKDMPTDIKQLQDGWPMFRDTWFAAHIKEKYQFADSLPGKSTVKRILLYGTAYMQHGTDKGTLARVFAALLLQDKNLSKKEQAAYDQLADEHDFLDACNGVGKKEVWPTLLVAWMRAELDGKDIAGIWQAVDDAVQDHPQWFCTEEPVKPKAFMQDHLRELQEKYPGLEFDKTLKSGELKCSKKDAWKLADAGVNDPLLTAYVNFGHAQKYKSSFTNREYLRSDGRVRCRFGIVESGRTSASKPNLQQYPSHDPVFALKNMYKPPDGTIFVSVDYSFAELVALAESCITKYGESVLGTIINADVCPHYFFAGVMMGLIDADVSFCKDPQEVERVKKFLKEHVSKDERQRAKAVKLIDRAESDPCTTESELLEVHNDCEATA